ncbi:MAG: hypothetical protein GWP37_02580, partial [Gammaproteobacteria bacterium]|nr:hypothetical protein [Gammaproteobacteria bacterium]
MLAYMAVINHSDSPVAIEADEMVATAAKHESKQYVTSNDVSHGRLEFGVQLPKERGDGEVTEETLRQRGLDLSNSRDLGLPNSPLLTPKQRAELAQVFIDEQEAIAVDPKRPGTSDYDVISLNTGDNPPQASKPYSIPYAYQELVRQELLKLLRYGLIDPCISSWASPVLVVVKKDHTGLVANIKLATDLRKLNAVTEMDSGSIGDMAEIVDKFNGKPYASVGDIASGYYNFVIKPSDRTKLAFVLPMAVQGSTTFCWNRAPYGVALLPAQFSRAIMSLLNGMHDDVSSFIDDLAVHTTTFERHLQVLRMMLRRLIMAGLTLKGSKVFILPPSLELLGYDVTPDGIKMQHSKTSKWRDFPKPKGKQELHSFLSAVSWYRRWLDNFSTVAAPLNDLLKQNVKWEWTEQHDAAFEAIREMLQSEEAMGFPDFRDPKARFWVFTDASDVAIAGILMQLQWSATHGEYRPKTIAHFSRTLNDTQRRWAIYEKEAAAMMVATVNWRKYLLGRDFDCFVDSTGAMTMLSKARHSSKLQRWGQILQEYMPGMHIGFKRSADNPADIFTREHTYASYVPQPTNELELQDELYERLYQLPTKFRGTFDLLQPKFPLEIGTLWGVASDDRQSEVIASCESQLQEANDRIQTDAFIQLFGGGGDHEDDELDKFKLNMMAQFDSMRQQVAQKSTPANSTRLIELEKLLCNRYLTPAGIASDDSTVAYAKLVDHYAQYIEAFKAMHGQSPRILCLGGDRELFALGVELAGCEPVVHEHSQSANVISSSARVSRDYAAWGVQNVHAIHAYGEDNIEAVITAASFISSIKAGGINIPTQIDQDGVAAALNFDIHDRRVNPPFSASAWKQTADGLPHLRPDAKCTEHSVQGAHADSRKRSIMHGQLLSGQMIATYMHRVHGMPLWTHNQTVQNPSHAEQLREWSSYGYLAHVSDGAADAFWDEYFNQQTLQSSVRVLQRVGEPPFASKKASNAKLVARPMEEREVAYAQARER